MSGTRVRVEEVLIYLGVRETRFIEELRGEGLFEGDELNSEEAEELRLAQILSEELGVNAAGIDVALHLRRRLLALESRARALAGALDESAVGFGDEER